ncbi:hypothetical protein MATR_17250 [Marivirga tractuosa]|uniref:DUF2191 domain-containing protein n=1 Tax=Marivirga tractuosa (strain ATCC 23168 / DSM 4126 / NBRC 15989 / NCIMB 1408 / VKM B-1430 / H-43) TaxID=643867 RepID=E4TRB6_MARTH|nr:hypothetical protein [Marivirga tractuosa]ADR20650.1 hypothetical protein Ftrac_0648 [Marivirga tractuosa DSM 4126]BDD14900.1 hypothetical protein MATR_17250 [Marivirga tractuosa]
MKVTALIPDKLIEKVKAKSGGKNITESLIIALNEYLNEKKVDDLIDQVNENPLVWNDKFTADGIRKINRSR